MKLLCILAITTMAITYTTAAPLSADAVVPEFIQEGHPCSESDGCAGCNEDGDHKGLSGSECEWGGSECRKKDGSNHCQVKGHDHQGGPSEACAGACHDCMPKCGAICDSGEFPSFVQLMHFTAECKTCATETHVAECGDCVKCLMSQKHHDHNDDGEGDDEGEESEAGKHSGKGKGEDEGEHEDEDEGEDEGEESDEGKGKGKGHHFFHGKGPCDHIDPDKEPCCKESSKHDQLTCLAAKAESNDLTEGDAQKGGGGGFGKHSGKGGGKHSGHSFGKHSGHSFGKHSGKGGGGGFGKHSGKGGGNPFAGKGGGGTHKRWGRI